MTNAFAQTSQKIRFRALAIHLTLFIILTIFALTLIGSTTPTRSAPTPTPLGGGQNTLFPNEVIAKLFWLDGRTVVVGLGQASDSEYTLDYRTVNYADGALTVRNYQMPDAQIAENMVRELNLMDKFDTPDDEIHFAVAPDHQHAVYYLDNHLFVFDAERHASHQVTSGFPIGEVNQVAWLDDNAVLLVVKPPYGSGNNIVKVCLDRDCFTQFDSHIPDLIGVPAISEDHHFAVAASLTSPNTFYRIDLTQQGIYQVMHLNSIAFVRGDVAPLWANQDNAFFLIGSDEDASSAIYEVTIGDDYLLEETRIVGMDDDLAYATELWLVDEEHQLSFHALQNGGLRIFSWRP